MFDLESTGGTLDRQPNSTHVVNIWHVPGGSDYSNAKTVNVFFSDEASAEAFDKKWSAPPEMPILLTIEQHDILEKMRRDLDPCSRCSQPKLSHIDRIDARPGQCDTWTGLMTDHPLASAPQAIDLDP
jgi:hypothetical protein